jgi:hypothetical protein
MESDPIGYGEEFLLRMMEGKPIERVHVKVEDGEFGYGLSSKPGLNLIF